MWLTGLIALLNGFLVRFLSDRPNNKYEEILFSAIRGVWNVLVQDLKSVFGTWKGSKVLA